MKSIKPGRGPSMMSGIAGIGGQAGGGHAAGQLHRIKGNAGLAAPQDQTGDSIMHHDNILLSMFRWRRPCAGRLLE